MEDLLAVAVDFFSLLCPAIVVHIIAMALYDFYVKPLLTKRLHNKK